MKAWNAGGGLTPNADTTWSNGANWVGGVAPPSGADVVIDSWVNWYVNNNNGNMGNMLITLDSSKTIGNLLIQGWWDGTNTINCAGGNTYTLNVSGNLTYNDYDMNSTNGVTLTPIMNIQGQLLGVSNVVTTDDPRNDWPDEISNSLYFTANGNTIGGGIVADWEAFDFSGNNNTFNGGITLSGFNAYSWRNQFASSAGTVSIAGSGNTFGAGAINLNQFGSLILQTPQNLSNITAINFNGGNLQLGAAMTALPAGMTAWNVTSGQLIIGNNVTNSVLGPTSLPVNLGGANTFGTLVGCEFQATYTYGPKGIPNAVNLNGNGGIIDSDIMDFGGGYGAVDDQWLDINGAISGTGMLIKIGGGYSDLTSSSANSYSGGTVVVEGRLLVDATTSLGTGNVTVTGGGWLSLNAAGNVAPGADVLIEPSGNMNYSFGIDSYVWYNTREYPKLALEADVMPTIDPASSGVIWLDCGDALMGGGISNSLHAAAPGNGTMFISGGWPNGSWYSGDTMAPGADNTYRFGYGFGDLLINTTCLVGNANVLNVGVGFGSWCPQTFTGKLTIQAGISINNWNDVGVGAWGGGYTLGDPSGSIEMDSGYLYVNDVGAVLAKNDLSYNGTGGLMIYNYVGSTYTSEVDFTSLTRIGKSFFWIASYPGGGPLTFGGATGEIKVNVTGGGVTMTNGMVAPYMIFVPLDTAGAGDFMSIDPTNGFAAVSYVPLPGSGGAGTEIASTAGQSLSGPVNVWALKATGAISGGQTITLGSGGLIFAENGSGVVNYSANFQAGDGTADLTVFANGGNDWWNYSGINGNIYAGALVKGGPGMIGLGANNTGTLNGDTYIDQGYIRFTADNQFGATSNIIHLNGGGLYAAATVTLSASRTIMIGINGGAFEYSGLTVAGPIVDDSPGGGPVYIQGSTTFSGANNTYTGGTVVYGTLTLLNGGNAGTGTITVAPGGTVVATTLDPNNPPFCSLTPMTLDQSHSVLFINGSDGSAKFIQEIANADIGTMEGDGDYQFGLQGAGYLLQSYPTLTVGALQSSDFYGRILQPEGNRDSGPWGRPTNDPAYAAGQGNVVKVGNTTLTLWGQNSWMGTTTINQGTLQINGGLDNGAGFSGGAVTVNNTGTLSGTGTVERSVTVNVGGTLAGGLHITGGVNIYGGMANVIGATIDGGLWLDTDQVTFTTPGSYSGSSTVNGDSYIMGGAVSGTHTFNGTLTVDSFDAASSLTGTNIINGTLGVGTWGDPASVSGNTTVNNPGGSLYLSGSMTGTNTINLGATGVMQVNPYDEGPTTFGGTGTVNAQWFVLNYANTVVSGTYTFNSAVYIWGGTFEGNHTINGSFTTAANSYAIVAPHNGVSAGTMTIVGAVTLDHSTMLDFNLGTPGTIGGGINDLITITGSLSLDGTLNVTGLTGFAAGTYTLMTYTGLLTEPSGPLTLGTMPSGMGYTYTIDTSTFGQVNLDVVLPWQPGDTNRVGPLECAAVNGDTAVERVAAADDRVGASEVIGRPVGVQEGRPVDRVRAGEGA